MRKAARPISVPKVLLYLLLIIPFFKIPFLTIVLPELDLIYNIWLICSGLTIAGLIVSRRYKWSKLINFIALFLAFATISTLFNSGDLITMLQIDFKVILLSLLLDYGLTHDRHNLLTASTIFFTPLIIANLGSILLAPQGLYTNSSNLTENWLLGYRNSFLSFILPALLFSFAHSYAAQGKLTIKDYLLYVLCLLSIILTKSSTATVFIALIGIYLIFHKVRFSQKILNIKNLLIAYIAAYFGVVIFRVQELFRFFIVNILHKDLTLTYRTFVWDANLQLISQQPVAGHGLEDTFTRYNRISTYHVYHAHNQILELVYQFGLLGLLLFLPIIILPSKKLYQHRQAEVAVTLSVVLFSFLIALITEYISYEWIIYPLVLAYHVGELTSSRKVSHA